MRYTLLGNSGLRVSEVALGTMTFRTDWGWGHRRAKVPSSSSCSPRPAVPSSTRPTSTPTAPPRRSSATCWRPTEITSSSAPSTRSTPATAAVGEEFVQLETWMWRACETVGLCGQALDSVSSDGRHLPEKEPTGRVCGGGAGLVAGPGTNWSASIRELAGGLKAATGTAVPSASRGSAMFARSSRSASTAPVPLARRCPRRAAGLTGPGTVRY